MVSTCTRTWVLSPSTFAREVGGKRLEREEVAERAEAAALVPKGVVCLISALQFHELTLQMPSEVWMAIDRTAWRPRIEYPPVRFVRNKRKDVLDGEASRSGSS